MIVFQLPSVLPPSCVPVFLSPLCVCVTVKLSGFSLAGFLFISVWMLDHWTGLAPVVMKLTGQIFLQCNNKHLRLK